MWMMMPHGRLLGRDNELISLVPVAPHYIKDLLG